MEKHYAFIKNGRVDQVFVFDTQNDELAALVAEEKEFDSYIWCNENVPAKWSTYDGQNFILPTLDYLYSIGESKENQAMFDEKILKMQLNEYEPGGNI